MKMVRDWYQRTFSNPELVVLLLFLVLGLVIVLSIGNLVLPVLIAMIIAYLLDGVVTVLEKRKIPRLPSVLLVYALFLAVYLLAIFGMIPLVIGQTSAIVAELPKMVDKSFGALERGIEELMPDDDGEEEGETGEVAVPDDPAPTDGTGAPVEAPDRTAEDPEAGSGAPDTDPRLAETDGERSDPSRAPPRETGGKSAPTAGDVRQNLRKQFTDFLTKKLEDVVPTLLGVLQGGVVLFVYLILFPILVFFMLKDKLRIQEWFKAFLPTQRKLVGEVWRDVDRQMANYVRGKAWEILIVGGVTFFVFTVLGLNYALLLSLTVGFSVLVPYVGATLVTFPVAIVAYAQWGFDSNFLWVLGSYAVIQAFDGNLLVPLIFSEAVNLHPIAIIFAVLLFGGVWGFWGVVLAIPLATLVQAVIKAWPKKDREKQPA